MNCSWDMEATYNNSRERRDSSQVTEATHSSNSRERFNSSRDMEATSSSSTVGRGWIVAGILKLHDGGDYREGG